ncbi:hypothetical protein [Xanthomonas oryzae]|uniref:hypothetical protein n=1 Tax=Xanthomonas oryzae TaxID=347 RepID=UPI0010429D6E|nr:hypothetical protein [Xanthomonas oryzae]QBG84401.1 hypothetical protein EYR27_11530 [Xanthomonas oryzae]
MMLAQQPAAFTNFLRRPQRPGDGIAERIIGCRPAVIARRRLKRLRSRQKKRPGYVARQPLVGRVRIAVKRVPA